MTWNRDGLPELARAMAGRPKHEVLRAHVTELLRSAFDAPYDEIGHEVYILDGPPRICHRRRKSLTATREARTGARIVPSSGK